MYSKESLRKVFELAKVYSAKYRALKIEELKLCISNGNRKIGRVMNVSLMPGLTCSNCKECLHYCYDIKACLQYPATVIDARIRNTELLLRDRAEYFARIEKAISRRRTNKYFRWHVAGDIKDRDYLQHMIDIALRHPDFVFWTYTKNYKVVNSWLADNGKLPGNLTIMFSEWDGLEMINPYGMPEFSCKLKAGNKNHAPEYFDNLFKCPGNCDICKELHRGCIAGETTYADEH